MHALVPHTAGAPRLGRVRTSLSLAVCTSLLFGHVLIPAPVVAADTYYALRGQLDTLVNQRQAQIQTLASADGTVGGLLARDFLVALRPALSSAAAVIGSTYQQAAADPLAARQIAVPDRSAGSGTLLGAHLEASPNSVTAENLSPDLATRAAWRSAVLASTSLGLARAQTAAPAVPDSSSSTQSLILSPASFDSGGAVGEAVVGSGETPQRYQPLGDAEDLWPPRAVQSAGRDVPLRALDPRIWRASPPAPSVAPPVMTERDGILALRTYARVAASLSDTLSGVAPPPELVSAIDPAQRLTSVAGIGGRTGHYTLAAATSASFTPAVLRSSFVAPQITWAFSATAHLRTDTFTLSGSGSAAGVALQSLQLRTRPGGVDAPAAVKGTQMSIAVTPGGGATFLLTTALPDGTEAEASATLDNIANDPDVQAAFARERLALLQLQSIIPAGNTVYARLQPLYAAREQVYQQALSGVMARNQQVESYWWARSTARSNYLLARSRWLKHRAAYQRYLMHLRQVAGSRSALPGALPALSPTAPGARRVFSSSAQQSGVHRHAGLSMPPAESTLTPVVPLFGGAPALAPSETPTVAETATPILVDTATSTAVPATPTPVPATATSALPTATSAPPTATPIAQASPTSTSMPEVATQTPTAPAPTQMPSVALPLVTATPTSGAPSATALPSATETPVVATETPVQITDTPVGMTDTPVGATVTPTDTSTPRLPTVTATERLPLTAGPTYTAATPSATQSGTPTGVAEPSATATATSSATPKAVGTFGVDGPSPTPTPLIYVTTPPGPPPAYVPDPGLEPSMEPLPPPVLPLPGWLVAPPVFIAPTLRTGMPQSLNASGYANLTPDQLYADGAMDVPGGFIPPIQGVITTYWGGSTPWQSFHPGLDIAAPAGVPVHAAADGVVVYAGLAVPGNPTMSYGNCVLIQHAANISTLYGHMQLGPIGLQVQAGEIVHQGQIIGYEGATGWATGPHVHFEMRLNNTQFDPLLLVSARTILG